MIHSNLENTTGARGGPHIFFVVYYPIKLKDSDGRAIRIPNEKDRASVLAMINSVSKYTYKTNADGYLVRDGNREHRICRCPEKDLVVMLNLQIKMIEILLSKTVSPQVKHE